MHLPFTNRIETSRCKALAALSLLLAPSARAATACNSSDTSLPCRLTGVLHWLDAAAIVLLVILLAVIGFVIHFYRKNRADHPQRNSQRNTEHR